MTAALIRPTETETETESDLRPTGNWALAIDFGTTYTVAAIADPAANPVRPNGLTEGTARAHAELASDINLANQVLQTLPQMLSPAAPAGLAVLNAEVTRQAAMMAYVSDFRVMMLITVLTMPLLLLIRRPGRASASGMPAADAGH